jgi:PAS domain S-box-containing protein
MATGNGTEDGRSPPGSERTDEFFEWLLSDSPWVAFATDEDGRLAWWNARLSAVTGRNRADLDGRPAVDLFATDDPDGWDRLCEVVSGGGRVTLPVETGDGRVALHEFDGTARTTAQGHAYLYVGRPSDGDEPGSEDTEADADAEPVGADPQERALSGGDGGRSGGSARDSRIVETIRDGVFVLDGEGTLADANRPLASMLDRDREALVGAHFSDLVAADGSIERARGRLQALQRGEVESGTIELTLVRADGERFPAEVSYGRLPLPEGGVGAVGVVRDVTEREAREARLRDHRDQLARLNRIGEAAAAALDPVLEAGSREAIEHRVCERLADTDLYEVVWVGRPDGEGSVVPRTTAGADSTFHEVAERLAAETDHERSANRAFREGVPIVHHEGWETDDGDVVREAVDGTDLRATMSVPLVYRGTTYGALAAYSTRRDAFSEDEREALLRLGRAVGFAINAVGTRRLVHAHERTELEFRVGADASVLAAVSAAVDAECVLRWTTPATELAGEPDREVVGPDGTPPEASPHDLWLRVDVEGVEAEAVLAAAGEADVVEARVVDETATGCTVELRAPGTVPRYVVDAGARPREVVADAGRARVVAEAPAGADIRSVVEAFVDATGAELVAKRSLGDPTAGTSERESLSASLTEKQREALRTAEEMGYFDWPREHTAEEVADRLGVASATLHYHLRAAQRTLVRGILDPSADERES